jgi:PAS domain S-box-containing protein
MHGDGGAHWFSSEGRDGLSHFWVACEAHYLQVFAEIRQLLLARARINAVGVEASGAGTPDVSQSPLYLATCRGVETGDFSALEAAFVAVGVRWSRAGLDLSQWYEMGDLFRERMLAVLFDRYGSDPVRLHRAVLALQRYVDRASCVVAREYVRERESELRAQKRSTEEAMLRYTRLAESGIIGIFVCDFFGNITETNDCLLNMLGYSREELLRTSWVTLTPAEWSAYDEEAKAQLIAHGRSRSWEKEYIRKDGTRVPVVVGVAMLNETEGVAFVLDITERKRLEEFRVRSQELEVQNVRMREANRIQGEFLANMSHELRTPLNSIIGFSELLHAEEIVVDAAHQREFLGDILKSGRHLLQLIDDVLDLAKVESGKLDFWPEPIQLEPIVSEVCAVLRTWAAERRITLEFEVEPVVNDATLDPARLKQVLYNYVANGLKFTNAGGTVHVRVRPEGARAIRIEVADTGIGIAEHDLPRLFIEFQQLDAGRAKKHAGAGLGLALTKRIVEAQGGTVGVASVLGKGSQFFAVLPTHMEQTVDPVPRLGPREP